MIKLIASDVDGTLIGREQNRTDAETERLIKTFISSGIEFATVSGRDIFSLRKVFPYAEKDIWFVACNGALCVKDGKTLMSRPVSPMSVINALKISTEKRKKVVFCSDKALYVSGPDCFFNYVNEQSGGNAVRVKTCADIKGPVYKISFFSQKSYAGFDETPFDLRVCYDRNGWKEYVSRFVNKGAALFDLQTRLGMSKAVTAAAGNEMADSEMLMKAEYRFSSEPELAEATGAALCEMGAPVLQKIKSSI